MKGPVCYIVGAGSIYPGDLPFSPGEKDLLIAADGGFGALAEQGMQPDLLVGDFDSSPQPETEARVIRLPVVKDDTDTLYAVKEGFARGYRRFVIYGGLGGVRLSHTLANIQLLAFIRQQGGEGTLVGGSTRLRLLEDQRWEFPAGQKGILSLFAVSDSATLTLTGMQYSLTRGTLTRRFPLGVSNHFTGVPAALTVHEGSLLAVLEEETL